MRFETHSHSHYSNIRLIDSINKPKDMILTAAKLGYSGITLTDHEALCGHVEWLELEKSLKKSKDIPENFKCGLGNEIYLIDKRSSERQRYWHFILIAKNTEGHRALRELSSTAWINKYNTGRMERVPTTKNELVEIVKKYPNSLIATNACIGSELGGLVLSLVEAESKDDLETSIVIKTKINEFIKFCVGLFGEDFYIEIAPGISDDQKAFNKRIKGIAEHYHIKMIVATDAHYLRPEQREIHKSFLNSKDGEREVDSFYHDAYLMSDEEAYENIKEFYSKEEFKQMCDNSLEIMNKISEYNIFHSPIIPEIKIDNVDALSFSINLDNYSVLNELVNSKNLQEKNWAVTCLNSLKDKEIDNKEHLERLELEAGIIKYIGDKLGNCLFSYFNTFRHYIDLFWECGSIVGPGRGSAGSFLSNYLLGITQLDPIDWKLPYFRFLNKDRAELPDIDVDLSPSKRPLILKKIREERGEYNVVQVATFGTESSKAAIACACRGYRTKDFPDGIDVDISQYMASLVPIERGISWTISECLEGNEEKDRKPIRELINQFDQYPGLKEIVLGVEGLVCRRGQHASGVILYNNSPFDTSALMRSPNGDITTQFDLRMDEKLGDVKFDFLCTEICDKLTTTLELLKKDNYFPANNNLREIYNNYLHPSVIDLKDNEIWEALASGNIQDVFQFNTPIGIETVKAIHPVNPAEMTSANALLRLTAPDGQERPLDRYIKFKNDISLWYKEMDSYGLTKEEEKILEPYYLRDYGVPASQEMLMTMVMDPKISNFTLAESNNTRKVLAKKKVSEIPKVKEKFLSQCPSKKLGIYAWTTMMEPQMSYSFSEVHSLLYTFIGIQTLVVATKFPSIYWNCACLIVNSQSIEENIDEEGDINSEESNSEDDVDEDDEEVKEDKKKPRAINFGKIASAIGKMGNLGITVTPPNINKSGYTFSPDAANNVIRYGLSGISRVGDEIVKEIIAKRPYENFDDLKNKIKLTKPQLINLIKSGALDDFGDRVELMKSYIDSICDKKQRLTLQNMQMLINYRLIPNEMDFYRRLFNFNKYLKKNSYYIDDKSLAFLDKYFSIDILKDSENSDYLYKIEQKDWEKIYKKNMEPMRQYLKDNSKELLDKLNNLLFREVWDKDCLGNISKWEMDSISFYYHPHELFYVNESCYFDNFNELPENPIIEDFFKIKGKSVPIYKLSRIAGTVLNKDKLKNTVTLLTLDGVVNVKIWQNQFVKYDKQISKKDEVTGKKKVIEKSWFSRGNKLIIVGIRRGDNFIPKIYKNSIYSTSISLITNIDDNGEILVKDERDE